MTPDNLDTKLDDAMIEIAGRPVDVDEPTIIIEEPAA